MTDFLKTIIIFTVAAAFEMQITKEFETDEFDICPDIIVTQDRVF